MTNNNMQMATQMQTLSSQVMNSHTHELVHPPFYMPPFNHGFNMNQLQIFYQRPAHNPHVFYYRPVNTMNPQIYVPVQRPFQTHPPTHSLAQQQPVFGYPPSHVQQHPNNTQKCQEGPQLAQLGHQHMSKIIDRRTHLKRGSASLTNPLIH